MNKKIIIIVVGILAGLYLGVFRLSHFNKLIGYNSVQPTVLPSSTTTTEVLLSFLKTAGDIEVSVVAKDLVNPRVIVFDSKGRTLVSETKAGKVSLLTDANKDGNFESKSVLLSGLKSPHGLAFYADNSNITYLYVAETHQILRYPYDLATGKLTSTVGKNIYNLPADGNHFTRTIAFGPNFRNAPIVTGLKNDPATLVNKKLYVSVGSSCDVCEESTWKRAAILETDPDGSYLAEFAGGLRNSVFFAFHPVTKEIWATEMGRDQLGDNLPPDEINIIKVADSKDEFGAKRYGWPFCYGDKVRDAKFNPDKFERKDIPQDCSQTQSPIIEIPAHSAPLGLAFIPLGKGWPSDWEGDLLVALHGSWNRSEPTGYKIVRYDLAKDGRVISKASNDFISGWLDSSTKPKTYGRPVDLKFDSNGVLFVSDDTGGSIYKVNPRK